MFELNFGLESFIFSIYMTLVMNIYILNCVRLLNENLSRDYSYMYDRAELKNTKEMLQNFLEILR